MNNNNKTNNKLPLFVRSVIYSYLPIDQLLNTISRMCKKDREYLPNSRIVDLDKTCAIDMEGTQLMQIQSMKYALKMSRKYDIKLKDELS